MHILDIIVIAIIAFLAIIGAGKGFVNTVFGFLSAVIAVLVASLLAGEAGEMIYGFTFGGPTIGEGFASDIKDILGGYGGFMTTVPEGGYTAENVVSILAEIGIPVILGALIANPVAETLAPYSHVTLADVIAPVIANMLLSIIAFVILYIIVWAVITAIANVIKEKIATVELAKNVDSLLGLVIGALKGCVIVWVVVAFSSIFTFVPGMTEAIQETAVLKWFADNNVVTLLVTSGFDVEGTVRGLLSGIPVLQ